MVDTNLIIVNCGVTNLMRTQAGVCIDQRWARDEVHIGAPDHRNVCVVENETKITVAIVYGTYLMVDHCSGNKESRSHVSLNIPISSLMLGIFPKSCKVN